MKINEQIVGGRIDRKCEICKKEHDLIIVTTIVVANKDPVLTAYCSPEHVIVGMKRILKEFKESFIPDVN